MVDYGLDILLQGRYVSLKERRHPKAMEKYFLIHRWSLTDIPYGLYTERELEVLHTSFGNPSVRVLSMLMERKSESTIDRSIIDSL